jgi:chitinase
MRRHVPRRFAILLAGLVALVVGVPFGATAYGDPSGANSDGDGRGDQRLRQVGYFIQWGIYGRAFYVKNLDTSGAAARLTHVNYAFGNVAPNAAGDVACASGDVWADYQRPVGAEESVDGVADLWGEPLNGNFGQLLKLKAKHPGLKVMMSLGGWTWSKYFSDAALTARSRRSFVESCVDMFVKGNLPSLGPGESGGPGSAAGVFDGIDLDWEWPGSEGNAGNIIRPEDKRNFTLLVAEFRRQLDAYGRQTGKRYDLTAFLPAAPAKIDVGFEAGKFFRDLDFATVQGYDFHGTWESVTNHQSAIREPAGAPVKPDFSIDRAVRAWLQAGAPRDELVIGIPYYGQGWTGVDGGGGDGLFQLSTGAARGTWGPGNEDYKVLATLTGSGFTVHRDLRAGHAWLFDGTTFWTFDDPLLLLQKTLYIRQQRLGGAMVWELSGDDANATLTRTIHFGLTAHA